MQQSEQPPTWEYKVNFGSFLYAAQPIKRDEVYQGVWTIMEIFPTWRKSFYKLLRFHLNNICIIP